MLLQSQYVYHDWFCIENDISVAFSQVNYLNLIIAGFCPTNFSSLPQLVASLEFIFSTIYQQLQ